MLKYIHCIATAENFYSKIFVSGLPWRWFDTLLNHPTKLPPLEAAECSTNSTFIVGVLLGCMACCEHYYDIILISMTILTQSDHHRENNK